MKALPQPPVPVTCGSAFASRWQLPHRRCRASIASWTLGHYPVPLASRLPAIRIPLRPQAPDVLLRLQPLVDQAYDNGRYDDLDYTEPLRPPLDADESAWFQQRLQSCGRHERTRPQ